MTRPTAITELSFITIMIASIGLRMMGVLLLLCLNLVLTCFVGTLTCSCTDIMVMAEALLQDISVGGLGYFLSRKLLLGAGGEDVC